MSLQNQMPLWGRERQGKFGKLLKANLNLNSPLLYSFITYRALLKGQKVQRPTMVKVEASENVKGSKTHLTILPQLTMLLQVTILPQLIILNL